MNKYPIDYDPTLIRRITAAYGEMIQEKIDEGFEPYLLTVMLWRWDCATSSSESPEGAGPSVRWSLSQSSAPLCRSWIADLSDCSDAYYAHAREGDRLHVQGFKAWAGYFRRHLDFSAVEG
jgi:hypothetical protein